MGNNKETIEELCKWKLVVGDVFREPDCSKLLCVMVGDGVQITGTPVVTAGFLALGFTSPASRGIDAADRDDFTVSFPGYSGGLCCSTFAESHRRSSRRKKIYFFPGCLRYPYNSELH
ncbi:hypothetical protein NC652_034887 [Populus alba x Populus x berolinensis]|uniref:Transmembrane 9 superfamily member n=1 Tax=Populus alba x Populus x berolinensis TaxID=444605 RepID=A0AAD6LNC0_9ROSI|nr:hypothetical protein NC652_034887 [Populus alba x Populus x berolinensis]KAJ6970308.1 hypothetical protein NC653_034798 [Populus alba x Populus x berolinensis]